MTRPPILEATEVVHRYGRVTALADVSFAVRAGAVTCLLGDNGAGKSTLVKILTGVERPTEGGIRIDGEPVGLGSPGEARRRGIATVYQDLALIPLMSVWRNFVLGAEPLVGRGIFRRLDVATAERHSREALDALGIALSDIRRAAGTLSGGERQAVAIARALHFGARVLVLDEPTAALGVRQAAIVLDQVARARERGIGIVLVTHNPQHAAPVGDRFVVLRRGRVAGDYARGEIDTEELSAVMAGDGETLESR
ncbi:MAG: ATP-binding cassette domain-containing protein [Gemmatimonadota bacterium]